MDKFQYVAGLHGKEIAPVLALANLGKQFVMGNPRALIAGKRFIDLDLNKAFGVEGEGYEVKRAKELLEIINEDRLVVDLHTFTADSPPFCVVVDLEMVELARLTGIQNVVYMKHNIKAGHALIDHRRGISVEVGRHDDYQSYEETIRVVKNLEAGKIHAVRIFEAYGILDRPGRYVNFEKHAEGYYPVLAGKNSYDHFGIKTRIIEEKG